MSIDVFRKRVIAVCLCAFASSIASIGVIADAPVSRESQACIFCHQIATPGIVGDWSSSRHAQTTPAAALGQPVLARRTSVEDLRAIARPENAVSCFECHGLNPNNHDDNFTHFGTGINIVVTPQDCATCHPVEFEQYQGSKKAHAVDNLRRNPVYSALVNTILSVDGEVSDTTRGETCFACHGTEVKVDGVREISSNFGKLQVPELTNWPNQGVGRINPDGSTGSCASCHPRHGFSLQVARSPATCGQCHLEPDVPAYNVYRESKHGNIYDVRKANWDMDGVPWVVGEDFTAPTCAACHVSLVTDSAGNVMAERSHDFGSRLWVRVFGLIASHPQPKDGRTYLISNDDGLPMPTTFAGTPASEHLISTSEQKIRQGRMTDVCSACHSSSWISGYLERFEATVKEADSMVLAATALVQEAWEKGMADPANPFDELIESHWIRQWLFYANSVRYASAMLGPDYAAFKNGFWYLKENLLEMEEMLE